MAQGDARSCCFCKRNLRRQQVTGDDFAKLSCGCYSCPKCIFGHCCNRKSKNILCPIHNTNIETVIFAESSREISDDATKYKLKEFKLDMAKEPGRCFADEYSKKPNEMQNKIFLSVAYARKPKNASINQFEPSSVTAILDSVAGFESEDDESNLRLIFSLLHDPIIKQHTADLENLQANQHYNIRMTPADFINYCETKDKSLLLKLMYALATGKVSFKLPAENAYDNNKIRSNFYAICVAKNMLERTMSTSPGPFQKMIGDMMAMVNVPNLLRHFFSKIRLSCSVSTSFRALNIRALTSLLTKTNLGPLDLFCLHLNNFGFKGKKKFAQHTSIQFKVIPEKSLRDLGFYDNYNIRRDRKTMDELIDEHNGDTEELVASIVSPNERDYKILSKRIMATIETVCSLDLPSLDECYDYINANIKCRTMVPSNLGVKIDTDVKNLKKGKRNVRYTEKISSDLLQDIHGDDDDDDDTNGPPPDFYEKNNIQLDNVLHGDPNAAVVVKQIVDYQQELSLIDGDVSYPESGNELPLRTFMAAATADGAPVNRWLRIQCEDIGENTFEHRIYQAPQYFFGGFHFLMELMSMRGRLSRDITSFFARKWRPEDPSFNWIYIIRDPNDGLNEWRQYSLAHYKAACDCAHSSNPAEINDYMIQRAIEKPVCMALLFDLRLLEFIYMTRDAEKAGTLGSVPLFLCCLRFALPLFAMTHATTYCHLVCDFLEWYALASQADKILFENFFYVNISPHGKSIWVDRGVEWTVRHIRMFMGHRVRPISHDRKVEQTVAELPFHMKMKKELRHLLGKGENYEFYTSKDWNEQTFELGDAFLYTRIALHETNIWGTGNFTGELAPQQDTNPNVYALLLSKFNEQEDNMSSSFLEGYRIGVDRIIEYFICFHIDERFPLSRGGLDELLRQLPTTHQLQQRGLEITRICRCLTNPDDFKGLSRFFSRDKMFKELNTLRDFFYPDIPRYEANTKRETLAVAFCMWRKLYFESYPEYYLEALESVEELAASEAYTTYDLRSEQIKAKIYSLDQDVVHAYRDSQDET